MEPAKLLIFIGAQAVAIQIDDDTHIFSVLSNKTHLAALKARYGHDFIPQGTNCLPEECPEPMQQLDGAPALYVINCLLGFLRIEHGALRPFRGIASANWRDRDGVVTAVCRNSRGIKFFALAWSRLHLEMLQRHFFTDFPSDVAAIMSVANLPEIANCEPFMVTGQLATALIMGAVMEGFIHINF